MSDAQSAATMRAFIYPDANQPDANLPDANLRREAAHRPVPSAGSAPNNASPSISAEALNAQLLQARAAGIQEGELRAREQHEQALLQEKAHISDELKKFGTEAAEYYSRIEMEVVKLALAIAAKILHREAQVDPMLVAALVRVALDKLHKNTKSVVRVRPEEASGWRQYFAQHMEQSLVPEVIEDPAVAPHGCALETDVGSTELGVETQLKEIENGLFDLLAQRPNAL
jgi:flagellar assembly protein FliH